MTSYSYRYVKELAEVCKTGTATNVIYGLALGYLSTIIPIIVLCIVVYYSHSTLGYLGVALSALGMLSNLPICLAIDSYGPISDNAGGIAEMSELPPEVRERTDILDSAGNTTAAVGKGFAIGSATLVGFALYGAFMHTCFMIGSLKQGELSFDDPLIFTSLLFGAMVPYAFSALTMKSVGEAAHGMIEEVRLQIREHPGILDATEKPNYKRCVEISTQSSLKEMIMPGLLVIFILFRLQLHHFCLVSSLDPKPSSVSSLAPSSVESRWPFLHPTPVEPGIMPKNISRQDSSRTQKDSPSKRELKSTQLQSSETQWEIP